MTFFAERSNGPGEEGRRLSEAHAAWDDTILPLIYSVPTGAAVAGVWGADMGDGFAAGLTKFFFTGVAMCPGGVMGFVHTVNEPAKPMATQLKTYAAGMAAGAFLVVKGCSAEAAVPLDTEFMQAAQSEQTAITLDIKDLPKQDIRFLETGDGQSVVVVDVPSQEL